MLLELTYPDIALFIPLSEITYFKLHKIGVVQILDIFAKDNDYRITSDYPNFQPTLETVRALCVKVASPIQSPIITMR